MVGSYKLKSESPKPPAPTQTAALRQPPGGSPPTTRPTKVSDPIPMSVGRLASLDAYRGLIMLMLAAGGFGVARFAALPEDAAVWHQPVASGEAARAPTDEEIHARRDWWTTLAFHFSHPSWRSDFLTYRAADPKQASDWQRIGVSFWDLIQPAFMFMVGVAMPFSFRRRTLAGESAGARLAHAFVRAVILVLLGVFLATSTGERTEWVFTNVLAQIGLGYFFVYLLLGMGWRVQAVTCILLLAGYWYFFQIGYWQRTGLPRPDGSYDYAAVAADPARGEVLTGRFAPWSKNDNAAHQVDLVLLNRLADPDGHAMDAWRTRLAGGPLNFSERVQFAIRRTFFANEREFRFNGGGYQTLNFIPSMATMLLGVICGTLLLGNMAAGKKLAVLVLLALVCLALGRVIGIYACPIVKRIWTPSWALFSGGYVIAMLALFYALFDVLPLRRLAFPLTVVGMNSMVMYLMGQLMRGFTRDRIVEPHLTGLIETLFGTDAVRDGNFYLLRDDMYGRLIEPLAVLAVFWLIAYWLWRRKIFVRI